MESLYGLCEYGISVYTIRLLMEKNITPQALLINAEEILSNLWNKDSMKMKKIVSIIQKNPNVFKLDTLYKLDECNLNITLIENMISKGIKPENIETITKEELMNRFNFGNVISDKIMKGLSEYKRKNTGDYDFKSLYGLCEYGVSIYTVRVLRAKNITPKMLYENAEEILSNLWNKNSKKKESITNIIANNKNVFEIETLYSLDEYNLNLTIIKKLIKKGIKIEDLKSISKQDLIDKYHFNDYESKEILKCIEKYKRMNRKDTKYDYIDFLANCIKEKTRNQPINKYMLKEKIASETRYPMELFENDIKRLKESGKIEESTYGIRYVFPTLAESINLLKKDSYREILIERFSGKTLESIGSERNITKEGVRVIIKNACKSINTIYEEKYLDAFCQYNFDSQDFQLLFKTDNMVYYYFKEKYKQGSLDIFEYIKNNSIPKEIEEKIYKKYNTIIYMGERIKLTKLDITNVYLKNLKNPTRINDINKDLNKIFIENGLEEHSSRALEAMVDRNNYAIATINRKFRGYNLLDINEKIIEKLEKMFDLKKGYYSTLMIYNTYKDFFEEIDIRDEYELHDLIRRKIHPSYNIKFERMPNFIIGDIDKKQFFYSEILKYSPINIDVFLSYMEKDYGHKKETLNTYIQKEFSYNINQNMITIEYPKLNEKIINILKGYLIEEIYNKEEVLNMLKEVIGHDFEKYFNKYNMDKLNYKIVNNYVLRNTQRSIDECIRNRIMKNDFYEIEDIFATSTYYLILSEMESKLEIIKFNENSYITLKKLEKEGIKKEDIDNYKNFIVDNIGERRFFTIAYIQNNYKFNLFEEYGFEDIFFESIIQSIDMIKKIRFAGTKVFCIRKENFSKIDFISEIVNDIGTIDIYKLKELLKKEYGIIIEKEDLQQTINESNLYYDKIIEKVFRNKEEYYKEVYK